MSFKHTSFAAFLKMNNDMQRQHFGFIIELPFSNNDQLPFGKKSFGDVSKLKHDRMLIRHYRLSMYAMKDFQGYKQKLHEMSGTT